MELLGKHLLVLDQGERHRVIAFAVLFIFIAVAIPIGLSIYLVRDQGLETEKGRALNYAGDALRRSEITIDQINSAFEELKKAKGRDACSPTQIATMRERDLASSYIQAIGHVEANALVCSSLGRELRGIDLGPVELVQGAGLRVRTHVQFPFAPEQRFIVLERDGYAAIIHRDLPIDATTDVEGVLFAVTFIPSSFVLTSRGELNSQWLQPLARGVRKTMLDEDYVVAIATSERHPLQAVAAVPASQLQNRLGRYALVLVPIGFLVASLTGAAALFLARRRTSMQAVMNSALRRNEFFLEYQPIVDLCTRRWVGAEALIRWRRMEGETVAPDRFIPIAEAHGLSQWLSCRVVELVARDAPDFFREFPNFRLSINLTASDLHDQSTVVMLRQLAAATGARRGNLAVEATERFLTEAKVANETVRALRAEGVSVSIDDFGTGYSSLSYLERLEIDTIKIDKSFIDTLNRNAATSNVVHHIIEMGKSLKKDMIAEGVEDQAQAEYLYELGVRYGQGWLFSKAISFEALKAHLKRQAGAVAAAAV